MALTKKDIDLREKLIIIDKTVIFDGNNTIIKSSPKTDAGNRSIPIPDVLRNVLTEYLTENNNSVCVFPMQTGEPMTQTSYRRLWEKILRSLQRSAGEKNGLNVTLADDITPHLFRHTYATDLYYAGVNIKTAQYLLGHSSIQMTLEIYTHLDKTNDKQIAERINSYHNAANKNQSKISQ